MQLFACGVGTPALEAALAALTCPELPLLLTHIVNVSAAAIHMLSCHSGLQSIDIGSSSALANLDQLDLQPLAALPSLSKLIFTKGTFCGVETLLHLTNLHLSDAHVTALNACISLSKLVQLSVRDSLLMLPGQGLAACHKNEGLDAA